MVVDFKELIKKRGRRLERKPEIKPGGVKPETRVEKERPWETTLKKEEVPEGRVAPPPVKKVVLPAAVPKIKSTARKQIESILSEDLSDIYLSLPKEKQVEFKEAGEETAGKIEKLMQVVKINVKKIVDLIRRWLRLIPGVNKFFLEQEAKIKTDKIINLSEKEKIK